MKPLKSLILPLLAVLLVVGAASAEPPSLSREVTLRGHGGASLKTPDWKVSRTDDTVTVLDRSGSDSRGGFNTLVLALEEGPKKTDVIDWKLIRDNVSDAAKRAGTALTLELAGDWSGVEGFEGQQFTGTMRRGDRDVAVNMVALIAPGVMVTVTALGVTGDASLGPLVERIAKTTTRPGPAP